MSFADTPDACALPTPIVRGIAGGLHGAVSNLVRQGPVEDSAGLAEEMLRWTMLFQNEAAERLAERMTPRLSKRMREISLGPARVRQAMPSHPAATIASG
jgi:hypothetical protein